MNQKEDKQYRKPSLMILVAPGRKSKLLLYNFHPVEISPEKPASQPVTYPQPQNLIMYTTGFFPIIFYAKTYRIPNIPPRFASFGKGWEDSILFGQLTTSQHQRVLSSTNGSSGRQG